MLVALQKLEGLEKLGFIGRDKKTRAILLAVLKKMKLSRSVFFRGSYAYIKKGRLVDIAEVVQFFRKEVSLRDKA